MSPNLSNLLHDLSHGLFRDRLDRDLSRLCKEPFSASPLPPQFSGTLPSNIYPLTFEDITPGELLFTVSVWANNSMHIEHERPFVIRGEPRKTFLRSSKCFNGREVELACLSPYESLGEQLLSSYGLEEVCSRWRTFRWSPRAEAYLRDLVARQAFSEYLALITRPRVEAVEPATVSTCRSASSGGSSNGSQVDVARKRIGGTNALKQRFIMQGVRARIRANHSEEPHATTDTNPDNED